MELSDRMYAVRHYHHNQHDMLVIKSLKHLKISAPKGN